MSPAADALESALADLQPQPSSIPFFSTVTGERCDGESCEAAYWARGIRQPVLFAAATGALADFGVDLWRSSMHTLPSRMQPRNASQQKE
jgi:acyl transferase domain-containing protein